MSPMFEVHKARSFTDKNSTELLITSNLTLKRKQFCTPREGNPGIILLTSRICPNYFYQCCVP